MAPDVVAHNIHNIAIWRMKKKRKDLKVRIVMDASPLLGRKTGVAESVELMLRGIQAAGHSHEISLFANSAKGKFKVPTDLLEVYPHHHRWYLPNRYLLRTWEVLGHPSIERFVGSHDLFHATNYILPPIKNSQGVVTVHDIYFMRQEGYGEELGGKWFRNVLADSLRRAAIIHVPSQATKEAIGEFFPFAHDLVRVVPWGLSAEDQALVMRQESRQQTIEIVAIGTIEPRKDYALMLEAAVSLKRRKIPFNLHIFGGGNEKNIQQIKRDVKIQELKEHVTIHDYSDLETIQEALSEAALFLSTSHDEGFCLPLLHAFRAGTPAVVTNAGALPEVVGNAGLVVQDRSGEAIADAVRSLIEDETSWRAASQAATERYQYFSLEKLGKGLLEVYAEAALVVS